MGGAAFRFRTLGAEPSGMALTIGHSSYSRLHDRAARMGNPRGISSSVERQLPKLERRVRFPYPASPQAALTRLGEASRPSGWSGRTACQAPRTAVEALTTRMRQPLAGPACQALSRTARTKT